jgi:hypothetical protein
VFMIGYGMDTVSVSIRPYGLLLDIRTRVVTGKDTIILRSLVGQKPDGGFSHAVVVGDYNQKVTLTGTTRITGSMLTGPEGYQSASYKGIPYRGSHNGELIKRSGPLLSRFNADILTKWSELVERELENATADDIHLTDSLPESAGQVVTNGSIFVDGHAELPHGTVLIAKGPIRFASGATAQGLLVHSLESIHVGSEARLSGQFIARDSVVIGSGTYLEYPSMICLMGDEDQITDRGVIRLGDDVVLDGTALIPPKETIRSEDQRRVVIPASALIRGAVYSHARTELHGRVEGTVQTRQFFFFDTPTYYINWIRNSTVDVGGRPETFVLPYGIGSRSVPEVLYREVVL